jgi:hypothetical protein
VNVFGRELRFKPSRQAGKGEKDDSDYHPQAGSGMLVPQLFTKSSTAIAQPQEIA